MANEITVNASIQISNGNFFSRLGDNGFRVNQTTAGGGQPGYQIIGTSAETISQADLTGAGWVYAKNLDSVNFCELGADATGTFVPVIKLKAGEATVFRLASGITFQAKANTANVKLQIAIFEN